MNYANIGEFLRKEYPEFYNHKPRFAKQHWNVVKLATLASSLNPESREIGEGMALTMKQLGENILAEFGDVANESEQ